MSSLVSGELTAMARNRLKKEETKFREDSSDELKLEVRSPTEWHVSLVGAPGTIYSGEKYTLQITFTSDYPMDSPVVVFLGPSPQHEHVYSNGHICLNILGDDWSPALTVKSVVLSVLSMMSSATKKERPHDDTRYSSRAPKNPKNTSFHYHDDAV